jgi:2-oxo-hept-3-ene-1,7-dioate hydratase
MAEIMVLHPAIELIGNRYQMDGASKAENSLMTIADNGGGIGFVFGDPVTDWQHIDFQNHRIDLQVSGGAPADNFLGDMRCVPAEAAADLVNHLAHRGEVLEAGHFISTGAASVPQPFGGGDVVHADFGVLGTIELRF